MVPWDVKYILMSTSVGDFVKIITFNADSFVETKLHFNIKSMVIID